MTPADPPQAGPCPEAAVVAAFHDGSLDTRARDQFAAHASACPHCRNLIGALERMRLEELPAVPELLRRHASGQPGRTRRDWRWPAAAAVAASVLVAVAISRDRPRLPDSAPVPSTSQPSAPVDDVRAREASAAPVLIVPSAGHAIGDLPLTFRWTPVVGALQYRVQVLNGDGDIAWSETTSETSL